MDRISRNLRIYLEALRALLDQEAGKGWPVLHTITSIDAVLKADQLDLPREIDYVLDRLAEVRKAHEQAEARQVMGAIPLPESADVPDAVRRRYEQTDPES